MKKILSLLLALTMLLSLCACGKNKAPAETPAPEPTPEPTISPEELVAEAAQSFYAQDFTTALVRLEDLETSGLPQVQELLGSAYYLGLGTQINYSDSVELLNAALAKGSIIAGYMLGEASASGNGAKRDPDAAEEYYSDFVTYAKAAVEKERTVETGRMASYLADCYANGKGVKQNNDKAIAAADLAVSAGGLNPFDCIKLAGVYLGGKLSEGDNKSAVDPRHSAKTDSLFASAFSKLKELSDAGNVKATKLLGDMYFNGYGGALQDYTKARELYEQAAALSDAEAQAQLGYIYQKGYGVEVDYQKAMEWSNKAAQQGNAQGQAQIGYMYQEGLGVTKNLDEAGRWYIKAVDQGNAWASDQLAQIETTNPHDAYEFHA